MESLIAGHSQLKGVGELLLNHPTVSISCHPGRWTEELFVLVYSVPEQALPPQSGTECQRTVYQRVVLIVVTLLIGGSCVQN